MYNMPRQIKQILTELKGEESNAMTVENFNIPLSTM
jgi:hypothetical protein